jgi:hypothetical protein
MDETGNPVGTEYDLVADGTFSGQKLVMLGLENHDPHHGEYPEVVNALEQKGFKVQSFTKRNGLPSAAVLNGLLETANQLWVVSDHVEVLTDEDLDVIEKHWKDGMGIYIFAENDPFYHDANRLLARLTPGMKLRGNSTGGTTIGRTHGYLMAGGDTAGINGDHVITTGVNQFFEGDTISFVDPEEATKQGFEIILRDHGGPVYKKGEGDEDPGEKPKAVTVARKTQDSEGPLIIDGGWTRLWSKNFTGATARYIMNCAAFLAVDFGKTFKKKTHEVIDAANMDFKVGPGAYIDLATGASGFKRTFDAAVATSIEEDAMFDDPHDTIERYIERLPHFPAGGEHHVTVFLLTAGLDKMPEEKWYLKMKDLLRAAAARRIYVQISVASFGMCDGLVVNNLSALTFDQELLKVMYHRTEGSPRCVGDSVGNCLKRFATVSHYFPLRIQVAAGDPATNIDITAFAIRSEPEVIQGWRRAAPGDAVLSALRNDCTACSTLFDKVYTPDQPTEPLQTRATWKLVEVDRDPNEIRHMVLHHALFYHKVHQWASTRFALVEASIDEVMTQLASIAPKEAVYEFIDIGDPNEQWDDVLSSAAAYAKQVQEARAAMEEAIRAYKILHVEKSVEASTRAATEAQSKMLAAFTAIEEHAKSINAYTIEIGDRTQDGEHFDMKHVGGFVASHFFDRSKRVAWGSEIWGVSKGLQKEDGAEVLMLVFEPRTTVYEKQLRNEHSAYVEREKRRQRHLIGGSKPMKKSGAGQFDEDTHDSEGVSKGSPFIASDDLNQDGIADEAFTDGDLDHFGFETELGFDAVPQPQLWLRSKQKYRPHEVSEVHKLQIAAKEEAERLKEHKTHQQLIQREQAAHAAAAEVLRLQQEEEEAERAAEAAAQAAAAKAAKRRNHKGVLSKWGRSEAVDTHGLTKTVGKSTSTGSLPAFGGFSGGGGGSLGGAMSFRSGGSLTGKGAPVINAVVAAKPVKVTATYANYAQPEKKKEKKAFFGTWRKGKGNGRTHEFRVIKQLPSETSDDQLMCEVGDKVEIKKDLGDGTVMARLAGETGYLPVIVFEEPKLVYKPRGQEAESDVLDLNLFASRKAMFSFGK